MIILSTLFGSAIYGTRVATSDTDIKKIFIPDARDILLQRAPRTLQTHTKAGCEQRNSANDIDVEEFALHQYLKLLMQGQTVALDMLFTPVKFHHAPASPIWHTIQANKERFLHQGTSAFVGYARQQAAKYGIKGTRIAALRLVIDWLSQFDRMQSLNVIGVIPFVCASNNEFISLVDTPPERYFQVCNRKIGLSASVGYTLKIFQKIFDQYGERARMAEKNEGVDWKALMHAVRVCDQALELFAYATITFPRPNAEMLLKIRKGEIPYTQVAEMIEGGLAALEVAKGRSVLRATPDLAFADEIIVNAYHQTVLNI